MLKELPAIMGVLQRQALLLPQSSDGPGSITHTTNVVLSLIWRPWADQGLCKYAEWEWLFQSIAIMFLINFSSSLSLGCLHQLFCIVYGFDPMPSGYRVLAYTVVLVTQRAHGIVLCLPLCNEDFSHNIADEHRANNGVSWNWGCFEIKEKFEKYTRIWRNTCKQGM